jgi:alcohol dehydrogenase class IV
MRVRFEVFRSGWSTWEELFSQAAAFATRQGPDRVIGISHSAEGAADRAIRAVERLRADIGIPHRLRDVGVRAEQLPAMAEKAFRMKRILRVNPRPASQAELESILQAAW